MAEVETFEAHFNEFVGWRRAEAADMVPRDPEESKKLLNEQERLTEEVVKLTDDEKLVESLTESIVQQWSIAEEQAYRQGMADGIRFCVATGLISK
ncbi:MAG: hypothetical protein ABSC17_10570 [Thermacetogeniaceae bacterium]